MKRWWLVPALAYVATIVVFLAWAPENHTAFPLDDAWIHRVYARAFAFGHGFAYNAGVQEAGCTSPLWVVITAPLQWLEPAFGTGAVVVAVKLGGAALGALVVAAVYRLAHRLCGAAWPAAIAATIVAIEPELAFAALSGMEVVLVVALWLWLVVAVQAQRWRWMAIWLGLLPVARPEGALLAALVVVTLLAQRRRAALTVANAIAAVLPTALWIGFCLIATGHLLPNTYYVKAAGSLAGLADLGTAIVQYRAAFVVLAGAAGLAAWTWRNRAHAPIAILLAGGSLLFVAAIVTTRDYKPLGFYWTRWTDPGALGFAAAAAIGLALAVHAFGRRAALAAIVVGLVSVPGRASDFAARADRLTTDARVIERMNVEPGRWLAAHTPSDAVVGVNDAGALRYFGARTTIDLMGLNNADVAFRRVPMAALVAKLDWVAIYPIIRQLDPALATFAPLRWFSIAREDYTICDCPGPTDMFVARKADGAIVSDEQRRAMIDALRAHPGTAHLVADDANPISIARAGALHRILIDAGWSVDPIEHVTYRLRPGWFVIAADNPWPPEVDAVRAAFEAAGLAVDFASGYRAYLATKPAEPHVELAPDRSFMIVVGGV